LKLCIAEKPSVAREIASVLGAKIKKDGYIEGNGYAVTWTFGHLCTLKTPDEYTPMWKRWNMGELPMFPEKFETKLIKAKGVSKQFKTIKSLVAKCDEVINCGDAGIEGELIQRWVLNMAGSKKPMKRLWISSLTEEAIREGFEALVPGEQYDSLFHAGEARAIGDWLLGMNASRLYTLKFSGGQGVLSIGRVQTPTLALIVKRHEEIVSFKPEPYWVLQTKYRDVIFNSHYRRIMEEAKAQSLLESVKDRDFEITRVDRKKAKEYAPWLFDLTSLQVECNKKYGMSADETLKIAQKLYERKIISYPRVDTRFLPSDIYPKAKGILGKLKPLSEVVPGLIGKEIKKSKRVFDDSKVTDHHAIIPTGNLIRRDSSAEWRVFELIWKSFIAVFCDDCIVMKTAVEGKAGDVKFTAKGREILEEGWRVLYAGEKTTDKGKDDDNQILPEFKEGESGLHEPMLNQKETTPPKYYTEATLLRAMESAGRQVDDDELRELMKENGIGRPSTRANIIETLFRRKYIKRNKKSIVPTETGIELIAVIENELLKSVELTGIWEGKLRKIEKKEFEHDTFIDEMTELVRQIVEEVKASKAGPIKMIAQKKSRKATASSGKASSSKKGAPKSADNTSTASKTPVGQTCPLCCRGKLIQGKAAWGCSSFREGCSFVLKFELFGKRITDNQAFQLVSKGKTGKITGFNVQGEKVSGSLYLNEKKEIRLLQSSGESEKVKKKRTSSLVCPACGKGELIKGKTAWGCTRFRNGCSFIVPFEKLQQAFGDTKLNSERLKKVTGE